MTKPDERSGFRVIGVVCLAARLLLPRRANVIRFRQRLEALDRSGCFRRRKGRRTSRPVG